MGNKEDWKELEKWNEAREESKKIEYGMDFSDIPKRNNKVDNFVKALNIAGKGFIVGGIIVLMIVIYILITIISIVLANMKGSFYIDVKKDIETTHFCKIKLISKDVVEASGYKNENGTYYFELVKCPDVKITAIKDGGIDYYDYKENLQKYLFNNWDNSAKNKFKTEEYIMSNGLLYYRNYIEAESFEEVMQATENIIQFTEYAEQWNKENKVINNYLQKEEEFFVAPLGMTFIKMGETIISPYSEIYLTADEIRESAKRQYLELTNSN